MATEQAVQPRGGARSRGRVRTRAEEAVAEGPSDESRSLSGEAVGTRVTPLEWTFYGSFIVIGAIMRFWDLGSRALHHDESLHATYTWYLWQRLTGIGTTLSGSLWDRLTRLQTGIIPEYHYDPMMHGPYQFHLNAVMYFLFGGPSPAAARLNAAVCGTALIFLPFLLRRQLGRVSALVLAGLLAFSPAFLYYSRFSREDIYYALWTALFFVGFIRWLDARDQPDRRRWLYVAATGFALSWATKESTFFITTPIVVGFIVGIFVVAYAYQFLAPSPLAARGRGHTQTRVEHPIVAALGAFSRANLPSLLNAFRGTPARAWLIALGIMAAITVVLYIPVGSPWQWGFIPGQHTAAVSYNTDAFTGGIQYWVGQQTVARGSQPWYYYFLVIPLYEQVAVVFGAAGLVYYFLHRRTRFSLISGAAFLFFTLLMLFVGTGVSAQMAKVFALPLIVSGVALLISRPRSPILNLLLWWTVVTWALYIFAGEKMPWLTLHMLLPLYFVTAVYLGHLFRAPRFSAKWLITAALLAVTALISFRGSVALAYVNGANPTEMLVYTQTSQDVPNVSAVVHKIPANPGPAGTAEHVWVANGDEWPWVWYLHDDPSGNRGYGSDESSVISAAQQRFPVILVAQEQHDSMAKDGKLASMSGYTGYEFKLRWWFPEDGYRAWETTGLRSFLGQALQPSSWGTLVNWWATRAPFEPQDFQAWSNVYPFYTYIRNDLVKAYVPPSWASAHQRALSTSQYTPAALSNDVATAIQRPAAPALVSGSALVKPMSSIQDIAVAASGTIYAVDATTQRVVALDHRGHYLSAWGAAGTAPGQFGNQAFGGIHPGPLGITVGANGHVYVSDSWNNRVEEFTARGTLVRTFGGGPNPTAGMTASSFFGPRQLTVAPNGNVYVADTGNERIQVYSPRGVHLFNIGSGTHSPQTALGAFDEPAGVTIDGHGVVYVADYWDKRIQRFTLSGQPLGAYTVAGWPGPQDYNEPYLAVDNAGHLFATDAPSNSAHVNHVLELDAATGRVIRAFGDAAAGPLVSPAGITIDPDGALYIADTTPAKLIKVRP